MIKKLFTIFTLMLIPLPIFALAEEANDILIGRFELEKLLNLGSGFLAIVLFILTLYAYKRNKNKRLFYVSLAFLLFAIKAILTSMELFFRDFSLIDPVASLLDFAILISFFAGILKK